MTPFAILQFVLESELAQKPSEDFIVALAAYSIQGLQLVYWPTQTPQDFAKIVKAVLFHLTASQRLIIQSIIDREFDYTKKHFHSLATLPKFPEYRSAHLKQAALVIASYLIECISDHGMENGRPVSLDLDPTVYAQCLRSMASSLRSICSHWLSNIPWPVVVP